MIASAIRKGDEIAENIWKKDHNHLHIDDQDNVLTTDRTYGKSKINFEISPKNTFRPKMYDTMKHSPRKNSKPKGYFRAPKFSFDNTSSRYWHKCIT